MALAQGRNKIVTYKRQTEKGTIATTGTAQNLRRITSGFELQKETYNTADEITTSQQMLSSRHGVKMVNGTLNGFLSPLTYSDMLSALLRRNFSTVAAITGLSITVAGAGPYTITRSTGSFLTGGIKVGMVVRLTAGTFAAANLNKNFLVTGVTALALTGVTLNGSTMTAEGPIASATVTVQGKVSYVPTTAHTNIYYTVEEWFSDVPHSERNRDVKVGSASLSLPGTGNATIDLSFMGLEQLRSTTQYFVTPTAETTSNVLVAASGALFVDGASIATVTDLTIDITGNQTAADGVVGTNLRADIFDGKVMATGSFTAYFDSVDTADAFLNEEEISILSALTDGSEADAEFMTIYMPRIKVNTDTADDGETGLKRTFSFEALFNAAGGASVQTEATTIQLQDSLA